MRGADQIQAFLEIGGRFTLSDDSHGVDQVGLNYHKTIDCVERAGITELYCLAPALKSETPVSDHFASVQWRSVPITDLKRHAFWST